MAFTNYTIVPEDGVVVIDGQVAQNVSMAGIPANVHAIQWSGFKGIGTVEYNPDQATGVLPAPTTFTNSGIYVAQTLEAETIIEAFNNPVNYYFTASTTYEGTFYNFSDLYVSTAVGHPAPPDSTTLVPPTVEIWQDLYWTGSAWVASSVDPALSLADAKESLTKKVKYSAAIQAALQADVHGVITLVTSSNPGSLLTADYAPLDLAGYQTFLDGEISSKVSIINAATQVSDLYNIDPTVNGDPTP